MRAGYASLATALWCVAFAVVTQAQAQSPVRAVAMKTNYDIVPPGDCINPQLPANGPNRWIASEGDRIAWCVQGVTTAAATASDYALYVDNEKFALLKACMSTTLPDVQCLAGVPAAVVAKLTPTGQHRLELTRTVQGMESARSVALLVETPGCLYGSPGSTPTLRPVGASIGGALTTGGLQGQSDRIAQLRRDGWFVQWAWDTDSNTVAMMMWCAGTPQ